MADAQERWSRHVAPFDVSAPSQKPAAAPEPDRSWMPAPTVNAIGGVEWHKHGNWKTVWEPAVQWAKRDQPAFHSQLAAAEATLSGLEKTSLPYDPKLAPARAAVSRHYSMLNRLYDSYTKSLPFVRY